MTSGMVHVRIDNELKAQASKALSAIGLSTADAVRLLFHRIVAEQAFPLELKVPNAATREAIEESRKLMAELKVGHVESRFEGAEDMFASLERGA